MTEPGDVPKIVKVADGFHVRQEIDNIAWIDMGGFAIVIDTLEHKEKEGEVFDAIGSTMGDVPISYVINTHTHYDHVGLNAAFRRRCGAEIINQKTTPLGPEGRCFEGTARRAVMLPMGGCHTAQDCIIHLPDDDVLFVGDLFGWGLIPLMTSLRTETAQRLVVAYERLIAYDAATIVPGHGPLCTTGELRRWLDYFAWLRSEAARGRAEGLSDAQIAERLAPPPDMHTWWRFLMWKHEDSMTKVIAATRAGQLGD